MFHTSADDKHRGVLRFIFRRTAPVPCDRHARPTTGRRITRHEIVDVRRARSATEAARVSTVFFSPRTHHGASRTSPFDGATLLDQRIRDLVEKARLAAWHQFAIAAPFLGE